MYQRPNRDWHSVNQTKLMCKILEMDYEIMRTLNPYRLVINNSYFILHIVSWEYQIKLFLQIAETVQNPIYIDDMILKGVFTNYVDKKILEFLYGCKGKSVY